MGKVPLKQQTILRLELATAALSIKMEKMLQQELQLPTDKSVFWSESTSVLKYISNDYTCFHTYVANRTSRIKEATQVSQWRYVDTKRNSADDFSRSVSAEKFIRTEDRSGHRRRNGQMVWTGFQICADHPQVKKPVKVNSIMQKCEERPTDKLLNHFSDWLKLRVAVARILNVKVALKHLVQKRKDSRL